MARNSTTRHEVQVNISSVLVTRPEAATHGVSLTLLASDYREQTGSNVPFRLLGYPTFLDYLQSIPNVVSVQKRPYGFVVIPVKNEKIQHVSELVAAQNRNRNSRRGGRAGSNGYGRFTIRPAVSRLYERSEREQSRNYYYNVNDNKRQLPVRMPEDSETEANDYSSDDFPRSLSTERPVGNNPDTDKSLNNFSSSPQSNGFPEEPANENANENDCNGVSEEITPTIISERVKIRLDKLILARPEGIWCAELPELYFKEYTIPLNYEELGFQSVCDFAAHLPDIFQCVQPKEMGDFKLYHVTATKPDFKVSKRPPMPSLASLHNIYEQHVEPTQAIPSVLPPEMLERLIPDGVMTVGETVGQICITELNRGVNDYFDVVVVDVYTPSFFWIHLLNRRQKFDQLMADLHTFYTANDKKYVMPIVVMEKGLNCACQYDNRWHRAIIKSVLPTQEVTVMFYDYGTVQSYPAECIFFLHRSFSNLPAQAIPCGLYNVKPVNSTRWTRSVSCEFAAVATNIPLVATIGSIDTDNNSMLIGLTNTQDTEDFYINDWMVQSGFAVYGKMDPIIEENVVPSCEQDPTVPLPQSRNILDRNRNGDTVDMRDACVDDSTGTSRNETSDERNSRKSSDLSLNAVIQDYFDSLTQKNLTFNSKGKDDSYGKFANESMRCTIMSLLSSMIFNVKSDVCFDAATLQAIRDLRTTMDTYFSDDQETVAMDDQEQTLMDDQKQTLMDSNLDVNMNISTKPSALKPSGTSTANNSEVGKKNQQNVFDLISFEEEGANLKSEILRSIPPTFVSDQAKLNEYSSICSELAVEKELTPRQKFESTMERSVQSFFDRMQTSREQNPPQSSANGQLVGELNPFKANGGVVESTTPQSGSPLRRPHTSPNCLSRSSTSLETVIQNKTRIESPRKALETKATSEWVEQSIDSKKSSIESWLKNDNFSDNNHANHAMIEKTQESHAKPMATNPVVDSMANNAESQPLPPKKPPLGYPDPAEWLVRVENSITFEANKKKSQPVNDEKTKKSELSDDAHNCTSTSYNSLESAIAKTEDWNIAAVQLTYQSIFLLTRGRNGWVVIEEFASVFTNKTPQVIQRILEIMKINIPFIDINRSENSRLFDELDRTCLRVPRNYDRKITGCLKLVPMRSVLKILLKLKVLDVEHLNKFHDSCVLPGDKPLIRDIWTLIKTFGEICENEHSSAT